MRLHFSFTYSTGNEPRMTDSMNEKNRMLIRWITYLMFMMFALTSDSVGEIIKEVKVEFNVSNSQASLMHSLFMIGIAFSGLFLGFLADHFGRKKTIILGLSLFAVSCYFFLLGSSFSFILGLITLSGLAVGVFKTAALALIGDISRSSREHTGTMNGAEAFFGVGAILGPLIVAYLIHSGVGWIWVYVLAGILCTALIILSLFVNYPNFQPCRDQVSTSESVLRSLRMLKDPYAMGFSLAAFLYVGAESAIYVWMPSYLMCDATTASDTFSCYTKQLDSTVAMYSVSIFFALRAIGRFVGIWLTSRFDWSLVLTVFCIAISVCFVGGLLGGKMVALYLFPLSGFFMSLVYPTFNSKGISCFPKNQHGTIAGVILFFTAAGAAFGPFIMGVVSDMYGGDPKYGFIVASVFSGMLSLVAIYNLIKKPAQARLTQIENMEYGA